MSRPAVHHRPLVRNILPVVLLTALGLILLSSLKFIWRDSMIRFDAVQKVPMAIPLIDAAAPGKTETATFGLG